MGVWVGVMYNECWNYFAALCGEDAPPPPKANIEMADVWKPVWTALARHYGASERGAELVWEHLWPKYRSYYTTMDSAKEIAAHIEAMVRA